MSLQAHFSKVMREALNAFPHIQKKDILPTLRTLLFIFTELQLFKFIDLRYPLQKDGSENDEDNLRHFQQFTALELDPQDDKLQPVSELEMIFRYFVQLLNVLKDPNRYNQFQYQHNLPDLGLLFLQCVLLADHYGPLRNDKPFNSQSYFKLYCRAQKMLSSKPLWMISNGVISMERWGAIYQDIIELLGFFDTQDLTPVDPIEVQDANHVYNDGQTALHYSAIHECTLAAQNLILHGANPNIPNKQKEHPLDLALANRSYTTAKFLFQQGAHCSKTYLNRFYQDMALDRGGNSLLHYLAYHGANIIENFSILKYPYNPTFLNLKNKVGQTALHLAVDQGNEAFVTELISHPYLNLSPLDREGHTPLYYAILDGNLNIAEKLIDEGAQLSRQDILEKDPEDGFDLLKIAESLERSPKIIETIKYQAKQRHVI